MKPVINRVVSFVPPVGKALLLPSLALATVVSKDGSSVYASSDRLFKGAIFGRDSLEVAEDLMRMKPALVRNIFLTLGRLQGILTNAENEEEPGKIIHEYRTTKLGGKPIDTVSLQIFHDLAAKWGGNDDTLAYYGSVDATPHFLRALFAYCRVYGNDILSTKVTQRDGATVTMFAVAEHAIVWLTDKLDNSHSGLLEYRRINPRSFLNHVWKDSNEFYVHESKELANHERPIASIEVQGLVYDALLAAAWFFPDRAQAYYERAYRIRDRTIELLWQPERQYFALGVDFNTADEPRIIHTATSNPASLLDTSFFDDLPAEQSEFYVRAIVERVMGKDFLTNAGIRSRSLTASHLVPFWDYHGSYVSWPKETYDIAKGFRRQGFPRLSRQLENRLLNIVLKTRDYPEFVYVDEWGRVLAEAPRAQSYHGRSMLIEASNAPERIQAWTVSAIMAIMSSRGKGRQQRSVYLPSDAWQRQLETSIMEHIPHIDMYVNPFKLWMQYPTHHYRLKGQA